jgi:hypothetical protein
MLTTSIRSVVVVVAKIYICVQMYHGARAVIGAKKKHPKNLMSHVGQKGGASISVNDNHMFGVH